MGFFGFGEPVAEAPDGFDALSAVSQLSAQRHDVNVDGAVKDCDIPPEGAVDEFRAREDPPRMRREELQKAKLRGREVDGIRSAGNLVALEVY